MAEEGTETSTTSFIFTLVSSVSRLGKLLLFWGKPFFYHGSRQSSFNDLESCFFSVQGKDIFVHLLLLYPILGAQTRTRVFLSGKVSFPVESQIFVNFSQISLATP